MFLMENYLNKEIEQIDSKIDVQLVHKVLKSLDDIKNFGIYLYSGSMDDGRERVNISLYFEENIAMEDIISEILEKFIGFDIEIHNISEREDEKNLSFNLFKKFCHERIKPIIITKISPEIPEEPMNKIKVIKLGEV